MLYFAMAKAASLELLKVEEKSSSQSSLEWFFLLSN